MSTLQNIHPGEILAKEFLSPLNITEQKLAKDLQIPKNYVSEIVKGDRRIDADVALKFSNYFGNSTQFWLGLQNDFDIEERDSNLHLNIELEKGESSGFIENFNSEKFIKRLLRKYLNK